ncbi:Crp/Fnr family transcriptional regulator [Flavihumibacter fluvii]|uniref:Crp/Fnr family transcriptional regulator n=1 Tax=Flavihumibacter fluvii TaxID=2838157 RepID=UPI001BDF03AA|nr:Crp/Fnr family transcriptional regulator [Flavihumibacter fluvii]ULQ53683.1 Crp/Fnr family transcriptional regulator [Flavihumibacter fluvii]
MPADVFAYISKFVNLSEAEKALFKEHIQIMTTFPRQVLTRVGEMEQHIYFIKKGVLRKYFFKGNEEITSQLNYEGDMVCCSVSFLSGAPSEIILETMEASTLIFITKSSLETLFAYSNNFEKMGRLVWLDWLLYRERWGISRMIKTPKERFHLLLLEKPGLVNRVPQKYLASLLRIKPETFSRYKKILGNSENHSTISRDE